MLPATRPTHPAATHDQRARPDLVLRYRMCRSSQNHCRKPAARGGTLQSLFDLSRTAIAGATAPKATPCCHRAQDEWRYR